MTEASLEQEVTAARHEHIVPGREIHMHDMRGYRFCEVGLITGTSQDNAIANIWNTTGACDPTPEQFDALDADTIARENGAMGAWLNPVRRWMFDRLDVWEAGDDKTFGSITGTWMGVAGATTMTQATVQGSYYPGYIYRNNTFTFNRGSEVYLLDAPDGEVFVMQSFTHTSRRTTCTTSTRARMQAGHSAAFVEKTRSGRNACGAGVGQRIPAPGHYDLRAAAR
jgi:hypothetical protein